MRFGDFIALTIIWTLLALFIVEFESRANADRPPIASLALALTAQNKVQKSLEQGNFAQACIDQKISNNILSMINAMPDLIIKGKVMEKLICTISQQKQGEVT